LKAIKEWRQKRTLHRMLMDPRSAGALDRPVSWKKASVPIRATTERLLRSMGARKTEGVDEWTLKPLELTNG
jgi:hypothetical protein